MFYQVKSCSYLFALRIAAKIRVAASLQKDCSIVEEKALLLTMTPSAA
jgi:hypothetical protein